MNISEAVQSREALPSAVALPSPAVRRPRVGTWEFERLAVQAFDRADTAAGGGLSSAERARIRAELATRYEVRHTRLDWFKDAALALALSAVAGTVAVFLIAALG